MKLTENETKTCKDGVVTIVNTKKMALGKYDFFCDSCGTVHQMSLYAIAQLSSGNPLVFLCPECYDKINLKPFNK